MSLRNSASNLADAMKQLSAEWQRTQDSWNDTQSRAFAGDYLAELPQQVTRAMAVIEELDSVLRKIKADCE